jgi:hypothetical protein
MLRWNNFTWYVYFLPVQINKLTIFVVQYEYLLKGICHEREKHPRSS